MQELINFLFRHPLLSAGAVIALILLIMVEFLRARGKTFDLNATQVTQMINHDNAVVIDLRGQEAFAQGHIIDALCFTLSDMQPLPQKIEKLRARPLIFIGNTGLDSQKIAAQALKQGYNAYSLTGGMRAWTDAQMPLIKGE